MVWEVAIAAAAEKVAKLLKLRNDSVKVRLEIEKLEQEKVDRENAFAFAIATLDQIQEFDPRAFEVKLMAADLIQLSRKGYYSTLLPGRWSYEVGQLSMRLVEHFQYIDPFLPKDP